MQTLKVFSETVQTLHHLVPTQNIKECIIFTAPEEPHTALSYTQEPLGNKKLAGTVANQLEPKGLTH